MTVYIAEMIEMLQGVVTLLLAPPLVYFVLAVLAGVIFSVIGRFIHGG